MPENRSHLRFVAAAAVAIFSVAGSVSAEESQKAKHVRPPAIVADDGATAGLDGRLTSTVAPAGVGVPFDTCASPGTLTLNRVTKLNTAGAADDYQTLADPACYSGIGQTPTTAPGRDVVLSFTAPAAGSYTFSVVQQNPGSDIQNQNIVLYLSSVCPTSGLVSCLSGANRTASRIFTSPTGTSNNQSEQVSCVPMLGGETLYAFFDNGQAGNNGADSSVEVRECITETEPNNDPLTASPMACGIHGSSDTPPSAHCHLGFRGGTDPQGLLNDGAVCTRTFPLDQSMPGSDTRCSISTNPCSWDTTTGIDTCPPGEGHCEQLTDLDCDPHCTGGPNDGLVCATNAFCNPGSAQNATCSGSCQVDSTCIVTATGADTGISCTPICVGGTFNGRYCSTLSDCTGGGGVCNANAACAVGQTCGRQYNEGDPDFYSLGIVSAGNKVFAAIDAKSANDDDWRLRITTLTDTLQFDDDDGVSRNGSRAPQISGAPAVGAETFIKVSRTAPRASEPYLLYSIVQGVYPGQAQLEDEAGPVGNDIYFGWPADVLSANYINNTAGGNHGYIRGLFNGTHGGFAFDSDCFKFLVNEGDLMSWYGDGEPARSAVASTQFPQPIIYDAEPAGISNFIFGANARKNALTANTTLHGLTPAVTSTFFQWRASYTGMLEVCYYDASVPLGLGTPGNGNWAGSLDVNCGPLRAAGPGTTTTDVSVEKTIFSGDGQTGTFVTYQIVVTNSSADIAQEVRLQDVLDPNLSFIGLTVDDGLLGNNTTCITTDGFSFFNGLPSYGTADMPIDCINTSMAPGAVTTYLLTVQVNNCIGAGVDITNTATISTVSTDPDPVNDTSSVMFTTTEDGTCQALLCDAIGCVTDQCNVNGMCDAGVCVTEPADCDDLDECTQDSCDPAVGCINDYGPIGGQCEDFNDCTTNGCDPVTGLCVYTPVADGTPCSDGLNCTTADHCDVGACVGSNVCDDGLQCTDDFADEGNGCVCSYAPTTAGTPCDDGDSCTGNPTSPDTCDGANACIGGGGACDDGDACTADSCLPVVGCVYTPISCDDGSICTGTETCDPATGCVPGTPLPCSDGDACNGDETCDPIAGCGPGTPPVCDDGSICTGTETCDPATGCVPGTPLPCSDGDACNGDETCDPIAGCGPGTPPVCDDGSICTGTETCDPATGCVPGTPLPCSDGDACNGDETCDPIAGCGPGTPPVCDDGSVCTGTETCDPATGCVPGTPLACDDADACNGVETCDSVLGCAPGTPLACDDADACNGVETCAPASGCVAGTPLACDDANVCTGAETCDPATGCVPGTPLACDDGDACTGTETCDPIAGCGTGTPLVCDDGSVCTGVETCDPATGCVPGTPLDCGDGDACTGTETCDPTAGCGSGPPLVCDDANTCNGVETCLPASGCVAGTPLACDDADACNGAETCDPIAGCGPGTPLVCDDADACNGVETCVAASGCVAGTPLACDDANACNGVETCVAASGCVAGTPLACDDGNACTGAETCDPIAGCGPGTPLVCTDNNVCNGVETCVPASGCVAGTPLTCSDSNACNGIETCNTTTGCLPGVPVVCTPLDQCHSTGVCNPATGVCSNPNLPNGTGCDDSNGCTTSDACNNGSCVGGAPPACNDSNACTADACTTTAGCTYSSSDMDGTGFSADRVDGRDLVVLADAWNSCPGQPRYDAAANLDQETSAPDHCVDGADFHLFMNSFGLTCPGGATQ